MPGGMCKSYKAMRCMSTLALDRSCDLIDSLQLHSKVSSTATISSLASTVPIAKSRGI